MIHFHYPHNALWFASLAFLGIVLFWSRMRRKSELRLVSDFNLLARLVSVKSFSRRRRKDWLFLIGFALLLFAATGPQFGSRLKDVKLRGVDVFIAMDTSRSMLAEDIQPSRIAKAKRSLGLLIDKLRGNRVGVIAFAKFAIIQCPLTQDMQAARLFLDILDTRAVPLQGTSIGDAIRLATKSFPDTGKGGKALVLLTDGEDHESDPAGAAEEAQKKGIVIYTIGIGSPKGDVIKERDAQGRVTEFHKYKGEMVLSRLDDALLSKIAHITGGEYFRASQTDQEIDEIADQLNTFEKRELAAKTYLRYKERYQIFLFAAFLLLLIEFFVAERPGQYRRLRTYLDRPLSWPSWKKKAAAGAALLLLTAPLKASIKEHVIKGNHYVKKQEWENARGEFESAQIDAPEAAFLPYNIANTYYLEGNFDQAKAHYEQALELAKNPAMKSRIAYNLGHLLFTMGNRDGAVDQFKECLRLNPKDVDAKYNIEYILSGKTPKRPFRPKPDKNKEGKGKKEGKTGEGKAQKQQAAKNREKKKGDLSKEDAQRVLQLIQSQETDNLKQQMLMRPAKQKKDEQNQTYEDW